MIMKELLPSSQSIKKLEKIIKEQLNELRKLSLKKTTSNNNNEVEKAIRTGRIGYDSVNGFFFGRFSAKVSKELSEMGAIKKGKRFYFSYYALPNSLRATLDNIEIEREQYVKELVANFDSIEFASTDVQTSEIETIVHDEMTAIDDSMSFYLEKMGIKADQSVIVQESIARNYTQNIERDIKGFLDNETVKLRDKVRDDYLNGKTLSQIEERVKKELSLAGGRLKFVARQELRLVTSAYTQTQALRGGSEGYDWHCVSGSKKHPVRPDHKALDKSFIPWNEPPIVDRATGRRAHAGEDFNCRCQKRIRF